MPGSMCKPSGQAALNDAHWDFTHDQDGGPFDTEQDAIDYLQ